MASTTPLTDEQIAQAIQMYGPVLRFHPKEIYFLCSVESLLAHSTLYCQATNTNSQATVDNLPTTFSAAGAYWLNVQDSFIGGALTSAQVYVNAICPQGATYTDIQFWFLYAYNGPGTGTINDYVLNKRVHSGDANLAPMGEHYGDWECCMIRVDNGSLQMIGAWLSQHTAGQLFSADDLKLFTRAKGQQIAVYPSLNGHANYAQVGVNYSEHHKYPNDGMPAALEFALRNDTADGGQTFDCSLPQNYQIVASPQSFLNKSWVNYPYRWGPEGAVASMNSSTVTDIMKAALGWLEPVADVFFVGEVAGYILSCFVTDDKNGPYGPKVQGSGGVWSGKYPVW